MVRYHMKNDKLTRGYNKWKKKEKYLFFLSSICNEVNIYNTNSMKSQSKKADSKPQTVKEWNNISTFLFKDLDNCLRLWESVPLSCISKMGVK